MPLANGFLPQADFPSEEFFDLNVGFCDMCSLMQLAEPVPRERMFHDKYPFFTASSTAMTSHFRALAQRVAGELGTNSRAFVVDIGSNDGTLLENFAASGIRHLGIEPSTNVAAIAAAKGVSTVCRFFDTQLAREILREQGQADVILATNCFCHVQDLHALAEGVHALLKPDGLLIFEDPYLGDILRLTAYDQIYDEHVYYFSLAAVAKWLAPYGMEVIDAQPQPVHGGSMRYTVARRGIRRACSSVAATRDNEFRDRLCRTESFVAFRRRIERSRDELLELLTRLRREDRRVIGYGATSKSTTLLNYCNITRDLVEFIVDTTPIKQGKFTPGTHIPVRPHSEFRENFPDCALLLAWNHEEEIVAKEQQFRSAGGKWIKYVPNVVLA